MYRTGRTLWGLIAIGAATAVGVTTRDAGFTVITFFGSLWLPRILGFRRPIWQRHGMGWHGGCAGAGRKMSESQQPSATQSI